MELDDALFRLKSAVLLPEGQNPGADPTEPDGTRPTTTDLLAASLWYAKRRPNRKMLVAEAAETGLPVVRHPFLQYPDDPEVWKISYQEFMLGPDFLIAPVTDKGDTTVKFYLPEGTWVHVWTGREYGSASQGTWCENLPAPLGQPAVFYRLGSEAGRRFMERG